MGPYMQNEGDIITGGPSTQKLTNGEDKDSFDGKNGNAGDACKDEGEERITQDNQRGSRVSTAMCNSKIKSIPSEDENTSSDKHKQGYKQKNFETGKKKRIEIQEKNNRQVRTPDPQGVGNADDADESTYNGTFDSRDDSRDDDTDCSEFGSTCDDCESSSYSSYEYEDISQFSDSDEDSECEGADTFSDEELESCTSEDSEGSFEGSGSFSHDSKNRSSRDRGGGRGEDFNKAVHYRKEQGAMNFCLMNNYSFSDENVAKEVEVAGSTADVGDTKETTGSEKQNKISEVALIQSKGCGRDSKEKLTENSDDIVINEQPTTCCFFRPSQPAVGNQGSNQKEIEDTKKEVKVTKVVDTTFNHEVSSKHQDIDSKGESANIVRSEDTKHKDRRIPDEVTDHGHIDDGDELGSGYDGWYCFQYSCLGFSPNKAIEMEEALKGRLQQKLKDTPPNAKVEKWNARYEKKELLKEKLARMSPKQAKAFKKKLQKAKLMKLKEKEKLAIKKKTDRDLRKKKKLSRDDHYNDKNKKTSRSDRGPSRSHQNVNKDLQPNQKQYVSKELQGKQQKYIAEQDLKRRRKKRHTEELSGRKNEEVEKLLNKEIKQRSGRKDNVVNRDKKNRGKPKRRSKKNLF